MSAHLRQYGSADEAAASAAEFLLNKINEAVKKTGNASVVLAGGSAPRLINAALLKLDQEINIPAIDWYFGDERAVGPKNPESNFRMQMETLLAPLGVDVERIHRIRGELGAEEAAEDYRRELAGVFHGTPEFDIIMLGLGPDGHTASLFPGDPAIRVENETVSATAKAPLKPHVERITITIPVINAAKSLMFFTGYAGKEAVIERLGHGGNRYPFELVHPESCDAEWFIYGADK
jgi:6-phosphogluconolactonase